jgi:hypothetical protein
MVLSLRCRSGQALAAAEADQPGAFVILIELAERTPNVMKNGRRHRGKYAEAGIRLQESFQPVHMRSRRTGARIETAGWQI